MGFWGGLTKVLGATAPIIAAPFTGGGSLAALPAILGTAGNVASGIAGGRAQGRAQEAGINEIHDRTALEGARLNLQAPQLRANNATRGDLLANMQPVTVSGPITGTKGQMPQISGGISPALLSQNSRDLGKAMSRDALLSQMSGPAFTPTPQPKANAFDSILNGLGYAGLAAPFLGGLSKPKQMAGPAPTAPYSPNVKMPRFG